MAETPAPTLETELLSGLYTEDEKSEILKEIEDAANSTHLRSTAVVQDFLPAKRGILFPVVINVVAVALVVGGWFGAQAYFQNRQEGLKIKTAQLFSTEATLLAKVLEDSKAELDAKNAEIGNIQKNLDKVAQEKNQLIAQFDSQLSAKENTLKAELAAQLESEKKRLQASGISQEQITARLNEFQAQKNAEFNASLDTYKKQAQAEIDQRTKDLAAIQAKLSSTQAETDKLKADYEKQNAAREKDLQSQLSNQNASLDKLVKERDELNLFFRQADAQFSAVRAALEAGDLTKAQTSVGLLRGVLNTGATSSNEAVRSRSTSDLVIATALDRSVSQLIEASKKSEADPRFEAFKSAVKRAQSAATPDERAALITKALASVPEIEAAVQIVQAWDAQKALSQLNEKLKAAETLRQSDLAALTLTLSEREAELEVLKAEVNSLTTQLNDVATSWQSRNVSLIGTVDGLQLQLSELEEELTKLQVYKTKWTALAKVYEANKTAALAALTDPRNPDFATAKTLYLIPFQTEAGQELFPAYSKALEALLLQSPGSGKPLDPAPIRAQAFADVLLFTTYLSGGAETGAKEAQKTTESLARSDTNYKEVVDAIQKLAQTGAKETIVKTNKYQLYGAIVSRTGVKLTIEPLTGATPSVGQGLEVRRGSSKGEVVLAQGTITAVAAQKSSGELVAGANKVEPAAGDTVYLILK